MKSFMPDKPLIESRGLCLVKLTPELVDSFMLDISHENVIEFRKVYRESPGPALKAALASGSSHCFAVTKDGVPLAITGIVDMNGDGLMWAVFANALKKNFVSFARASTDLVEFYHRQFPTLICDVWIKNEAIIQWLTYLGFDLEFGFAHNGQDMVRFAHSCRNVNSIVTSIQRPVIH